MHRLVLLALSLAAFATAAWGQSDSADRGGEGSAANAARTELAAALAEREAAEERGRRYDAAARDAVGQAERTARRAASLAARIQEAEAGIAAARARMTLIDQQQAALLEQLGRQQQPVVELTAALQQLARRPLALSVLQPGSVRDVVYVRAVLHSRVPAVRESTRGVRTRLDRARELRRNQTAAAEALRAEEAALVERRAELAELETQQRLAARSASNRANREAQRALSLAEDARDLDDLVSEMDRAAALRRQLAALPGPRLRPDRPEASRRAAADSPQEAEAGGAAPPPGYRLPVAGRVVTGFGSPANGALSRGLTIAPLPGAQVVAPAPGRVAFAGPYRGFGNIVIVEHANGWTSLITGLARTQARVGDELVSGAPIGRAAPTDPTIALELRRSGEPVNPARYAR